MRYDKSKNLNNILSVKIYNSKEEMILHRTRDEKNET